MRCISYLLIVLAAQFHLIYSEHFPKIQLNTITLPEDKQRIARRHAVLWFDENSNRYYKIWPNGYRLAHYFEQAVACGFYDSTNTMLTALIYHDTTCCGYITKKAEFNCDNAIIELESFKFYRHTLHRIAPAQMQSTAYQEFYYDLLARTKKFGFVYIDLNQHNIVLDEGTYKLIDLEYVLPFEKVPKQFFENIYLPSDYRLFVLA